MEWIGLVAVWLVIGWLPTRIMKHYFKAVFGGLTWTRKNELEVLPFALGGPINLISTLTARASWGTDEAPWGWQW